MAIENEAKPARLIGRGKQFALLKECKQKLIDKKSGSMILISAESGCGASALLRNFEEENNSAISGVATTYAECQTPVVSFHIGSLQPLYPFMRITEALAAREKKSAEKRLALNIGISLLSATPWVGDMFWAAKEIARDVSHYKREKKDADQIAGHQGGILSDMYDFFTQYAEKRPLIILLDTMQYADAQSVELLGKLQEAIRSLPLMVVIGYSPTATSAVISPLLQFIKRFTPDGKYFFSSELTPFTAAELSEYCAASLPNYGKNIQFERWLAEHTNGIPSLVTEYLRYFRQYPPFAPDGSMRQDISATDILPASIHAAFSKLVEQLSDDDRSILALCSVEGMESTVTVMSALMNMDALNTVRKLRSLQRRTGIIRSSGAKHRYGAKTTVYEFTQVFYYEFFRDSMEYEESAALHRQVASLLDKALREINDPATRLSILPYLAAHNAGAGDEDAAKDILTETAKSAEALGDETLAHEAFVNYSAMFGGKPEKNEEEFMALARGQTAQSMEGILDNLSNAPDDAVSEDDVPVDFPAMQREIIGFLIAGSFNEATDKARHYADFYRQKLLPEERAVLFVLSARAHIELDDAGEADQWCRKALDILRSFPDAPAECLAYNTLALIRLKRGDQDGAWNELRRAARISTAIGQEYQLLTASNIGNLLKQINPKKSLPYLALAKRMCRSLNFRVFMEEYLL